MQSWLDIAPDSDFSIHNFPFGVYYTANNTQARPCSAIGNYVIDLQCLLNSPFVSSIELGVEREKLQNALAQSTLNAFIALGKPAWQALRRLLQLYFSSHNSDSLYTDINQLQGSLLHLQSEVQMCLPLQIGNYTDFYSSIEHATNVGIMFRGKENALMPNWKHLPIAYHGRASSIVVSGTPLHRPKGQMRPDDQAPPIFGPTRQLDFELETAFVIGQNTALGQTLSTADADNYIFGMVLFNDWSARDIQKWEYQPLGPFLGKNFGSAISPWIVTMDALQPFRVATPTQDPPPLPYLQYGGLQNYDIQLEVDICTDSGESTTISRSNTRYLYWNMAQQLAQHTCNGCNVQVGDLMASGTISAPDPKGYGSMLELAWRGTQPLPLADGSNRVFILDGDTVTMRGLAQNEQMRVGFGAVSNRILPAL